jgi:glycerol-3-phosphate dehydrogenase
MAVHLNDFLARRTRLALIDPAAGIGDGALAPGLMAAHHGWKKDTLTRELDLHRSEVERERGIPLHPDLKPTPSSGRSRADTG